MGLLFRSYLDDSEHSATKLYGVGGFVGPVGVWDKLEQQWVAALPAGIKYFNASTCFVGSEQFTPAKGFDIPKRIELLNVLTDLVCQTDIKLICETIDSPVYMNFAPAPIENLFLGNKHAVCFEAAVMSACRDYMQPSGTPHPVDTGDACDIFYEASEYSDSVQRKLRNLREDESLWWRSRIGKATPGTKTGHCAIPLLQVADLGVFLGTKRIADAPDGKIPWRPHWDKLERAGKVWSRGKINRSSLGLLWALFNTQRHPEVLDEVWDSDKSENH
jgi:hypothetical protein